jgi:uncharacterized protein (TIGR02246 family)
MALSVADRQQILDTVTRADQAASDRDPDAYVRLFTPDAVLDGAQGRHAGREALRTAVGPVWAAEGAATMHLTLNAVIEDPDEDDVEIIVRSILLIVDPASAAIRVAAPITQILVQRNGLWLISRRTVGVAGPAPENPTPAD